MSEATKIPKVLDTTSQRDTTRLLPPMKRMRNGHQHHDGYPHSGLSDIPGPHLTPLPVDFPYITPPLQHYQVQLEKLQNLKEMNKSQETKDLKRPRLEIPMALGHEDTGTWRYMHDPLEDMAKLFEESDRTEDTPGNLYSKNRDTANAEKCKKDTQQKATNTETTGTEAPAAPVKKDREEVISVLIRELWNDIRKSAAEVSKLKDDKIADQQLQIEQLKAEAEKHRKKIKTLRAQRKDMDRPQGEIESVRSQLQYIRDQCKYHCECENCKDYESEDESQTD